MTSASNTAAQSNLQTALTGADTYYTNAGQTFAGILDKSSPSSIYAIDTGLAYVASPEPSSSAHVISTEAGTSSVVMTAWAPGTRRCWGIARVTSKPSSPLLGAFTTPGTYFFVSQSRSEQACTPTSVTAPAYSNDGFPDS